MTNQRALSVAPRLWTPPPSTRTRRRLPIGRRRAAHRLPRLRFTPYAWAKLLFLRDAGDTEIGGFGLAAADDPLLVEDVRLVVQQADWASVRLDDQAVADLFDELVDAGRRPESFARVWIHTHPGASPQPSGTDETTFARVFGRCDWSVMAIVARGGASYARLCVTTGPGWAVELDLAVEFGDDFPAAAPSAWQAEYDACVRRPPPQAPAAHEPRSPLEEFDWNVADPQETHDEQYD